MLTTEQVMLLCDCFQFIDKNGDGNLDASELDSWLRATFPDADGETLVTVRKVLIIEGDSNEDGRIDIKEFINLISQRQYEAVLAALSDAAQAVEPTPVAPPVSDTDARIQSILANLEPREIDVLRDAFIKLDTDGDGFLSRAELRRGVQIRLKDRFATAWPYLEKIFEVADRDMDNRLSIFEFLSSFADGPGVVPHEVVAECVEAVKIRLTDAEVEALRERFCEIDQNKDNYIDKEELFVAMKQVLSAKYPSMTDQEFEDIVASVMATADADQDGKLNLSEFIRSYQEDQGVLPGTFMGRAADVKRRLTPEEVEQLKAAFSELDSNADGFVDYSELYTVVSQGLRASGISETDIADLVDYIMLTADRNGDGKLSLTEFIKNFVQNEELMTVPVSAALERREAAKARIAAIVDSGDLYRMVKLFMYLDGNQDGFLDRSELYDILFGTLSQWYPDWTDEQKTQAIEVIFEGADVDGDGKISIDEFVASYISGYGILPVEVVREIAGHLRRQLTTEELQLVHDTFVTMDSNGDGFVTNDELRAAFASALGPLVDQQKLDDITAFVMSKVDTDRDGKVSLKEFILSCELDEGLLPVVDQQATAPAPADSSVPQEVPPQEVQPLGELAPAAEKPQKAAPQQEQQKAEPEPQVKVVAAEPAPAAAAPVAAATPAKLAAPEAPAEARSPIANDVSGAAITDAQLREQFKTFDKDGSGRLSKAEFKKQFLSLEWCGLTPSDADFEKLFKRISSKDHEIGYDEFCLFMLHRSRM